MEIRVSGNREENYLGEVYQINSWAYGKIVQVAEGKMEVGVSLFPTPDTTNK